MKDRRYLLFPFFVFLGFLIYSNTLYAPFIFDDEWYIISNHQIRTLSNFLKDFSGTRYIGFLSFALNYYFGGLNTFGYHLVNIVIHILNAILVYSLIILTFEALKTTNYELRTPNLIAFTVSLIFLVHPIQIQAVTYITQRFTSLATLFYLLAIVLYVKARINTMLNFKCLMFNNSKFKIKHLTLYFLSIISTILAMKTKEISFTLPFMIILYEFTFLNKDGSRLYSRFFYLMPYLLTLIIIPVTLFLPESNKGFDEIQRQLKTQELVTLSKHKYLLTQFNVIVTYIRLLFLPVDQHFVYDYPLSKSIFETKTLLSFVFLLSIFSFAAFFYLRSMLKHNLRGILISFGIFWFFITLSVESSIIPIKDVLFEHRLYLPSIGFILSIVAAYFYLIDHVKNKNIRLAMFFFLIIVSASLSVAAYNRNGIYKDSITILFDEAAKTPNRSAIRNELGRAYLDKDMLYEAEREFKKAIEISPISSALYRRNLGLVYEKKGLFDKAEEEYKASIKFSKYALGKAVLNSGVTSSIGDIISMQAHTNLGELYYKQGMFDKAITEYKEIVRLEPSAVIYNYLGDTYMKKGLLDDAEKAFIEAVRLEPDNAELYFNLGLVYEEKKMFDEAKRKYEAVLKIEPNFKEAREALDRLTQR